MAMHRSSLGLLALILLAFPPVAARAADCGSLASPKLDWQECTKKNLMLQGSDLEGANLFGTDFSLTDLAGANVKSANLEKATLVRASLEGAHEWAVFLIAAFGLAAVLVARDRLTAIVSLGIQGFAVAIIFLLFGAPDLSFTQFMLSRSATWQI